MHIAQILVLIPIICVELLLEPLKRLHTAGLTCHTPAMFVFVLNCWLTAALAFLAEVHNLYFIKLLKFTVCPKKKRCLKVEKFTVKARSISVEPKGNCVPQLQKET